MREVGYELVRHGRWTLSEDRYWKTCSECGAVVDVSMGLGIFVDDIEVDEMDYCPNCGAKMDEELMDNIVIKNSNATTVTNTGNAMSTETRGETMPDSMMFPKTVDEFMEQYKIVDSDEVYTNGAELVPIFRMKQWFEHADAEEKYAHVIVDEDGNMECSNCGSSFCFDNYCAHCGAKLIKE